MVRLVLSFIRRDECHFGPTHKERRIKKTLQPRAFKDILFDSAL